MLTEIRRAESEADFAGYEAVWNAITPSDPITVAAPAVTPDLHRLPIAADA